MPKLFSLLQSSRSKVFIGKLLLWQPIEVLVNTISYVSVTTHWYIDLSRQREQKQTGREWGKLTFLALFQLQCPTPHPSATYFGISG